MRVLLAVLACFLTASATAQQPSAIRIAEIRVQLFQEPTGTLSEDLLGPNPPELGNVIIASDPANSFLVTVRLEGPPDSFQERAELRFTVRSRAGRPAPFERRLRGLSFGEGGVVHKAVLVHDHVCSPVDIEVRIGRESRRAELGFRCGE